MISTDPSGKGAAWTGERLRGAPSRLVALLLTVELIALVWTVGALIDNPGSAQVWIDLAVLLGLGLVFEEMSRRVARIRLLISLGPNPDMTSVWTFAAAVLLPPGQAAVLAIAVAVHLWLRQYRGNASAPYRRVYTAATVVVACLAASALLHPAGSHIDTGYSVAAAALVVAAIILYTSVQRLLISAAVVLSGGPSHRAMVLGRWDENALEIATLCLGYLTALVLADAAWLVVLVVLPMVLLQRGGLMKQLERTASTDTKTQLLTSTAWRELADRALTQAARRRSTAALLIVDLDHFKSVNDLHGHLIGDAALYAASARLSQEVRQNDVVGRFGGEEVVVLLADADVHTALRIAERLRQHIGDIRLADLQASHTDGSRCEHVLSASIGVAVFPEHAEGLDALLGSADSALFVAKRAGRNRVELAEAGWRDGTASAAG